MEFAPKRLCCFTWQGSQSQSGRIGKNEKSPLYVQVLRQNNTRRCRGGPFPERGWWAVLVVRRKPEEGILIGGKIKVRILGVEGDSVKIGIEAPREIPVHRTGARELEKGSPS